MELRSGRGCQLEICDISYDSTTWLGWSLSGYGLVLTVSISTHAEESHEGQVNDKKSP